LYGLGCRSDVHRALEDRRIHLVEFDASFTALRTREFPCLIGLPDLNGSLLQVLHELSVQFFALLVGVILLPSHSKPTVRRDKIEQKGVVAERTAVSGRKVQDSKEAQVSHAKF
jgi:hypothetical protein